MRQETKDKIQTRKSFTFHSPRRFYTFLNKISCKEEDKFTKMTAVCHKVIVVG